MDLGPGGVTTYDFIVVGSGGGGLTAALAAKSRGASVIVLEKTNLIGGSTAKSGGVLWLPNSQVAERAGEKDSFEEGMAYFDAVVGDVGPASSMARRTAFLEQGREMIDFLESEGMKFAYVRGYGDYYDERAGGKPNGRVLKAPMLASRKLGKLYPKLRQFEGWQIPVENGEFAQLTLVKRTWSGRWVAMKLAARMAYEKLSRQQLLCRGAAVQARMLLLCEKRGIPIYTNSAVVDFVVDGALVCGVKVRSPGGQEITLRANRGVLMACGGFAVSAELRRKYLPQPSSPAWSSANSGDTGEMLERAIAIGAATDMLNEAIWIPVSLTPQGELVGFHNPHDMAKPFCIMVDQQGRRFVNEASSYMEIGQAMYAAKAVPAWIILESRHRNYYTWGSARPGVTPDEWLSSGYMKKADTLHDLARACELDPAVLQKTIDRFNRSAEQGSDPDFGRGLRVYDKYYGDPKHGPNPGLGPIEKPPFYAVKVYPGDVGTFGGLMTDEHGAVLRPDGSRIRGLYATGNCTASVMGRSYPGAGASIAASFIFGYTAAKHALQAQESGGLRKSIRTGEAVAR
jgi:3-oxosteroid 1-dehydrogenase